MARIGQALSALGTLVILARAADLAAVGLYASYEALFALLDVLVDGGSGAALVRRGGTHPESFRASFRQALRFRRWTAHAAAAAALLCAALDPRVPALHGGILLGIACLYSHLWGTWVVPFHLRLRFSFPAFTRSAGALAALLAVAGAAATGVTDPLLYLGVHFALRACAAAAIWWRGRKLLADYPDAGAAAPPGLARESLVLGAGGLIREAYGRLDVWLLRILGGESAAGLYAPARKTLQLALHFQNYATAVALPALAARAGLSRKAAASSARRLARSMAFFAWPAALISAPFAPWYLATFFGEEYRAAAASLWWLAAAAACAYPGGALTTGLVACHQGRDALYISGAALASNLAANLAAIPGFGPAGAAAARCLAEIVAWAGAALRLR